MTGPRRRLDELDAAWQAAHVVGIVDDEKAADRAQGVYDITVAFPSLTSALRAVADLADELDGQAAAERKEADYSAAGALEDAAESIRAALAPLAAPDTGDETT